jgi:hypothetical protein
MWRLFGVLCVTGLVACVDGGDAGDAATQGSLGGPCFANNTCSGNLVCTLVNGKAICETGDATTQDAPNDGTPGDVTTNDASDAGADVVDAGCTAEAGLMCGQQCPDFCCADTHQCNATSCSNANVQWNCSGTKLECECCITATISDSTSCPATAQLAGTAANCGTCLSNQFQLCEQGTSCVIGTCKPVLVDNKVLGFCMP